MIFTKNIKGEVYDKLLIFSQGIYAKHGKRARTVVQTVLYILNM